VRELLRLENIPVYQNKVFDTAESARACARGDVVLAQDPFTGLVSNIAFDSRKLEYDENYQNEQSCSRIFQQHLSEVLAIIEKHFSATRILEIGCGKGVFLEQLRNAGLDARGVDPAYEGDAPYIIKEKFEPILGVQGDAIVMRHVLEHIPQPLDFLETVLRANLGKGLIYIEVPCLEWILDNQAWFDIFYEHVNYFRHADFRKIFGSILESGHLFGGQYLYVVADLASLRKPGLPIGQSEVVSIPKNFFAGIENYKTGHAMGIQRVVWGAAAKGVMFSSNMLAQGLTLDFAIDISPAKQGKFLAASALQVLSPQEGIAKLSLGSDIFVMNSNYLHEIQAAAGPDFNYILLDGI